MDYPIHIDTIKMELSILYLKGFQVKFSIKCRIFVPEDCFISANSLNPFVAFHLGLHCMPNYLTSIQNEKG